MIRKKYESVIIEHSILCSTFGHYQIYCWCPQNKPSVNREGTHLPSIIADISATKLLLAKSNLTHKNTWSTAMKLQMHHLLPSDTGGQVAFLVNGIQVLAPFSFRPVFSLTSVGNDSAPDFSNRKLNVQHVLIRLKHKTTI